VSLQILPTKLYIPPWQFNLISRPSLVKRLDVGTNGKLTLLSAPAGYGKSTLLAEWIHQTKIPVAWLSVDVHDNDPERFWVYFLAALKKIQIPEIYQAADDLLESFASTPIQNYEFLFDNLISAILAVDQRFVLVMDDFHTLTQPQIIDGLFYLLENLPSGKTGLHLIISTRSDPTWPLARLRIRSELNEFRSRDLRFSSHEVTSFLNNAMNLALSPKDVAALNSRTEGWIAGLQMAAISMRDRNDKSEFIHIFTGSHRYVLDFLLEEVLERQTPELKAFLLQTSILERFNQALCDAVTAGSDFNDNNKQKDNPSRTLGNSLVFLDYLERNNLFLVALDDQRNWYRYHHLFADLLQNLLRQEYPLNFGQLHHRAAIWFLEQSDISSAIHHAFAVEDFDLAAKIIEDHALTFLGNHSLASVISLLDKFPPAMMESHPWLSLTRAWALAYLGDLSASRKMLTHLEHSLGSMQLGGDLKHVQGQICAIRCFLSFHDAEFSLSARYGYAALQSLAESDYQTRMLTASTMAAALLWDGKLGEAKEVLLNAIDLADKHSHDYTRVRLLCTLALIEMNQAKFTQAVSTLEKALTKSSGPPVEQEISPFTGQVYIRLSDIYSRMDQPELAMKNLLKGIDLAKRWGQANTLWEGYHYLTLQLHARGEIAEAKIAWEQALVYARRISGKIYDDQTELIQAEIWLEEKNFPALENWLHEKDIPAKDAQIHFSQVKLYDLLVEVFLARSEASAALEILAKTMAITQAVGATSMLIGEQLNTARAYQQLEQDSEAVQALSMALFLGKDSGLMTEYVKQCPSMIGYLQQLLSAGEAVDFIRKILDHISPGSHVSSAFRDFTGLIPIDQLSEREVQVLRRLNSALSVPDIARQIHLAPSTVRTHIQHIYSKLGVHSRLEALEKAQELGLL
jgi:LuxR family maltose regulon positive regulatory protein